MDNALSKGEMERLEDAKRQNPGKPQWSDKDIDKMNWAIDNGYSYKQIFKAELFPDRTFASVRVKYGELKELRRDYE